MKTLLKRFVSAAWQFLVSERGNLKDLTWEVGIGVVIVAAIVLLVSLAPNTISSIWTRFVNYVTSSFGF